MPNKDPKDDVVIPDKDELLATIDQEDLDTTTDGEEEAESYTEIEIQAMNMGWSPDGVEGKRNLTAEEFVDRKPIYDDISSLKRRNKQLEENFQALKQHQDHIRNKEREKVLQELKDSKKEALSEENYDKVVDIDDQIASVRAEAAEEENSTDATPVQNEVFIQWVGSNAWYNQNPEMRAYADTIGMGYASQNPGVTPENVYQYVENEVKLRFASQFDPGTRKKAGAVESSKGGRKKPADSGKYSVKDLPEDAKEVMKTLVRSKTMTQEEYLEEFFG